MRPYFEKMNSFGRELNEGQIKSSEQNVDQLKAVEAEIKEAVKRSKPPGFLKRRSMLAAK